MMRLVPELLWRDGRFHRGQSVTVDPARGRITRVGERDRVPRGDGDVVELPGRALLPGFVNVHSHAFQRLIRGRTHTRPVDRPRADFWSWREAMYAAALSLSPDDVFDVARFCFLEMMRTGITAVGEFHYLHHQPDGSPYPEPNELALQVIRAAEEVGLRIVLLNVCYATGGIGQALEDRQRRFRAPSLDEYLDRSDTLRDTVLAGRRPAARDDPGTPAEAAPLRSRTRPGPGPASNGPPAGGLLDPDAGLVTVGAAPHSIRAVPRDWLPAIREWASDRDAALHMHVSERPAEVEASVEAYGLRPVEVLAEDGLLDGRFTAIHGIHLTDHEVALLGRAGAGVCACPTTERSLGDGFVRARDLLDAGARLALGTDSHASLDFLEEMRLIEHHERLQRLDRVIITDGGGHLDHHRVAPELLDIATIAGARALRLDAGAIAAGKLADLVTIDLDHHSLAGWTDATLAAMVTLSATPDIVRDAWVAGRRRLDDRTHEAGPAITEAFRAVAEGAQREA